MHQYTIHQELLAACSEHFRNTLKGPIQEGRDSEMMLTNVTKGTFEVFMHWLYSHELLDNPQKRHRNRDQLFALCAFAARYQIPSLQKVSMNAYFVNYTNPDCLPTYETVIEAFELFPETSPICKFPVDITASAFSQIMIMKQLRSKLPHKFLVNSLLKSSKLKSYAVDDGDLC
jgi:hypothetical protein